MQIVAIGSLDHVSVQGREVFKLAVCLNAAGIIVGHNHPSGDPHPSQDDGEITRHLVLAGKLLGIPVWDHIIISGLGPFVSYQTMPQLFPR